MEKAVAQRRGRPPLGKGSSINIVAHAGVFDGACAVKYSAIHRVSFENS